MWVMMACCVECFVAISIPQPVLRIKCHCLTKSGVFGCRCLCSNILTYDELLCAMAITWLACLCHCLTIE